MMMSEQQPLLGDITPSFASSSSSSSSSSCPTVATSVRNRSKAVTDQQQQQQQQENISNMYPRYAKVCLARRKKPDPWYIKFLEIAVFVGAVSFSLYCYMYFDNVHFHTLNAYAHLGYSEAQHQVGQRYLHGIGTNKHPEKAMMWFKKASDQGHPHASYNLAIGHLKGIKTPLKSGDAHSLIADAAKKGLSEAHDTLHHVCSRGGCNR